MDNRLRTARWAVLLGAILLVGLACSTNNAPKTATIIVNSLDDTAQPASGVTTLRSAIAQAASGDTITFDSSLDGQTILLSIVGEAHTTLKGEVYSGMTFTGYQDRDYGASALFAQKDLVIDASALPSGITIEWNGGAASHARVLTVSGNLVLKNVTISSGHSFAVAITGGTQPYTLARGGGLAVWGKLTLDHCAVINNRCTGDTTASRDRGTYGGGIYANDLDLRDVGVVLGQAPGDGAVRDVHRGQVGRAAGQGEDAAAVGVLGRDPVPGDGAALDYSVIAVAPGVVGATHRIDAPARGPVA